MQVPCYAESASRNDDRGMCVSGSGFGEILFLSWIAEDLVPYALFENNTKLSRAFPTEMDVWRYAEDSGLVIAGVHG